MDNPSFCNKCGFFGEAPIGYHFRPRDGEVCNYVASSAKPSTSSNEELTQRMEKAGEDAIALLRDMAAYDNSGEGWGVPRDIQRRVIAFLADLPKPVDPIDTDLIEARECVALVYEGAARPDLAESTRAGKQDNRLRVQSARLAIARGRTLAAGGTAHE